ncbi:MAG: alkaline phosphatase PhoX [Cyanobacteria bacterium P01_E01_bin.42]
MSIKRRNFLLFMGASAGSVALGSLGSPRQAFSMPFSGTGSSFGGNGLSFQPVKLPIPLDVNNLTRNKQLESYSTYQVQDDVVLPPGYTYDVIGAWGDRVGDSRFGYNNDYLSFVETGPNEGYLTINFEYISGKTWMQTYAQVIDKSLPFADVTAALADSEGEIDAFGLPNNALKGQIQNIAKEALIDVGLGVISLRRNANGQWERTYSNRDRRITGVSGLEDGRYLKSTGPSVAVFNKSNKKGYDDGLGSNIIGTFGNCAGGTSPWGTVFSAEENFQNLVPEPVMADGSSLPPAEKPFDIGRIRGQGNPFGLAGNKYGWMVEVDPANPNDYGTKHTWLGRYRHEAVGFLARPGKKLAVYSGCDRRGGHLYKFVSNGTVRNVTDKANSRLLEDGMLYGAKFNPDGTGRWIPLSPDTAIDPVMPSTVGGGMVKFPNPDRNAGGVVEVTSDAEAAAMKSKFRTLGDLYEGTAVEKQGAILIDAHFAGNAAGITTTARPEDTIVAQDGTLYIAFTSGTPGGDGGPDTRVFKGPNGEFPYEFGWIVSLKEDGTDPASMTFRWQAFATGGEPAEGGMGFSNPDNIEVDNGGNLWMVTDMSTSSHNKAVPSRTKDNLKQGQPISQKDLLGIFGNNSIWFIPTSGSGAGEAYPFGIGPTECECCGPFFTKDEETLFLAVQHPGERNGIRKGMESETRKYALKTTDGEDFMQTREVPIGSNWPGKRANDPPKPAVIAIRRLSNQPIRGLG